MRKARWRDKAGPDSCFFPQGYRAAYNTVNRKNVSKLILGTRTDYESQETEPGEEKEQG